MTVKYNGQRFTGDALSEYVLANLVAGKVRASDLPALSWVTQQDLDGIDLNLTTYVHEAAVQMLDAVVVANRVTSDVLMDVLGLVKWVDILDFMFDAERAVNA